MAATCAAVGVVVPCSWMLTASRSCWLRSAVRLVSKVEAVVSGEMVSRVSHMMLLR